MSASVHIARLTAEQILKWEPEFTGRKTGHAYFGVITPYNKEFVEELKSSFGHRTWIKSQRLWILEYPATGLLPLVASYFFASICVDCFSNIERKPLCSIWQRRLEADSIAVVTELQQDLYQVDRIAQLFAEYGKKTS